MDYLSSHSKIEFKTKLAFVSFASILIGMFVSKAMISIGFVLIGLQFLIVGSIWRNLKSFLKHKPLVLFSSIFFIYLLSGLYSENTETFWNKVYMKSPILFMAMGLSLLPNFDRKYFYMLLYLFNILLFFTSFLSFINFLNDYEAIVESYKYARVMPITFSISHTRFSLMLAIGIYTSFFLYRKRFFIFSKNEILLHLIIGISLFLFIHLLSVRSGLLALYCATFSIALLTIYTTRKYFLGALLLLACIAIPYGAYKTIPTITNKISYMVTDVKRYLNGENVNYYSDGNRLLSIQLGLEIAKSNPILGIGIGDLEAEMFSKYEKNYPDISPEVRLTPHNQFIYIFAGCGLFGLLVFLFSILYPLVFKTTYKNYLFIWSYIVLMTSFLTEATIENQLGTTLYSFFLMTSFHFNSTQE